MKRKRKPRKRIGTRGVLVGVLLPALLLVAFLPVAAPSPAGAKKKPAPDTYAVVSGSVFDDHGYALPDANVTLAADPPPANTKPMQAVSDARGEFIFHVPPGPARYTVVVAAKGRQTQRKSVSVQDQERVEVTFQLEAESK